MKQRSTPGNFSVFTLTPSEWRDNEYSSIDSNIAAMLTIRFERTNHSHFFRDLQTGTILCINSNSTFSLKDTGGYVSGTILAQQMHFKRHSICVRHQDQRFSFTCNADLKTGFCFGWLVDRRYSKSYRILDPGKVS